MLTRIGSDYGGWPFDLDLIPTGSTVISAGIGNDLSFDKWLIENKGCHMVMIDPTALAMETVENAALPKDKYTFIRAALCANTGTIHFGKDRSNGAGIFSEHKWLVDALGINDLLESYPDAIMLKMDIEGAEYQVLDAMKRQDIPQIGVEFHHRCDDNEYTREDTAQRIERLVSWGYNLASVVHDLQDCVFIKKAIDDHE